MSKLTLRVLCLLLALAHSVSAQDVALPASKAITAEWILEKNLIATGGREAHQRLQSQVVQGDYDYGSSSSPSGEFTFSYKGPADDALQFREPEHETFSVGAP